MPKIFIVDDDRIVVRQLTAFIRNIGHDCLSALYPESVMESLDSQRIDLILLDINMPGIDGLTLLKRIKSSAEHRSIPVIMLTGNEDVNLQQECFEAGAMDFLYKPVNEIDLRARVCSALSIAEHINKLEKEIDGRKLAEEELRQSEEKYRLLAQNMTDVIFIQDINLNITYSSPSVTNLFGYSVEETYSKKMENILTTDSLKMVMKSYQKYLAQAEKGRDIVIPPMEYEYIRKDGSTFWGELKVVFLRDSEGRIISSQGSIRDITERKKAEDSLRESEKRLNLAMSVANDGMWEWDMATNKTILDQRHYTLAGYRPNEFPSTLIEWAKRVHPDDLGNTRKKLKAYLNNGIPKFDVEFRVRRKDGNWVWIRARGKVVVRDKAGVPLRMVGTHSDITERKLAEQALKESEERFRAMMDQSPFSIEIYSINGDWLQGNKAWEELWDLKPEDVLGVFNIINDKQLIEKGVVDLFRKAIAGEVVHVPDMEFDAAQAVGTGSTRWISTTFYPLLINLNNPQNIVCVHLDITDRKQAEQALKESEERFRTIFETARDAIFIKDSNLLYTQVNPSMEKFFDMPAEKLIGLSNEDLFADEDLEKIREVDSRVLNGEIVEKENTRIINDVLRTFHVIKVPMRDGSGRNIGLCGIARDITDRKLAEEELRESEEKLRTTLNSIGDAVIATDIDGIITNMNPVAEKLSGFTSAESVGQQLSDIFNIINSRTKQPAVNPVEQVLKSGAIIGLANHTMLISRSGAEYQIADSAAPILDADGNITGVVLVFRDVTEEYAMQEALRESEELFRTIFDTEPECVKILNPDLTLVTMNVAGLAMIEIESLDSMIGQSILPIIDEEFREGFRIFSEKVCNDGVREMMEFRITGLKGTSRWLESHAVPLRDAQGQITRLLAITRDITERKKAEDALRESKDFFEQLFLQSATSTQLLDRDGWCVRINPKLSELFGVKPEDIEGKKYNIFQDGEVIKKGVIDKLKRVFENKETVSWDVYFDIKNASETTGVEVSKPEKRWIHVVAYPILDAKRELVYVILQHEDITERMRAVESLRKLSRAVEQSPVSIVITGTDGSIEYVNPKFEELTGFTLEEVIGKNPNILKSELQSENYYNELWNTIISGKVWRGEFANKKKDGSLYWELASISPIFNDKGDITHYIAVKEDITDRKQAEEELRESEERFRALFEKSADAILIIEDDKFINCNDATIQMLGYTTKNEILNVHPSELSPEKQPDGRKSLEKANELMAIAFKQGSHRFEWNHIRHNGEVFPVEVLLTAIPFAGGNFLHVVWRDITMRKRGEEALLESEEKYRSITETATDAILSVFDNKIYYVNKSAERIFGYSPGEMIGQPVSLIIPERYRSAHSIGINRYYESGKGKFIGKTIEVNACHKDGHEFPIELTIAAWTKEGEIYLSAIIRDISKRKKTEAELSKMAKLESLGILAGGIAHNFKNILANISFNTSLAKHKPEKRMQYLEKIESAVTQASALATRFQTFSTGGDPITEIISLPNVIKDALNISLSGSEIESELNTDDNLWNIEADSKQLNEVFMNLIINSLQAMPKGGSISFSVCNIEIEDGNGLELADGKYVHVTIQDSGIGISEHKLPRIFEPFYSGKANGTGLGLSSALFIIQKHKGSITIDSEKDKWTKVEIYLPATEEDITPIGLETEEYEAGQSNRILFMDDEEALRENMQELGEILEYEVDVAKDGESAINAYKDAIKSGMPYEVVILDLTISGGGLQGEDVLKELLKINPEVKAIVFSGHSAKPIVARYEEYGFAGRLEKPVSIENLSKMLKEVCRKK